MKIIEQNINAIQDVCKKHHVKELYAFGSAAKDNFSPKSDVDLLVEFEKMNSNEYADNYFDFEEQLKKIFQREVDLVTAKYLRNKYFIQSVNESKKMIYRAWSWRRKNIYSMFSLQ